MPQQKDFALELKAALKEEAWVDLHEIDVGDVVLSEITAGIEAASDFVLLWTSASSSSSWVRYETHMAFIRYLEDAAINIRVVRLDSTPVPLHLRPLLQARGLSSAPEIADVLLGSPPSRRALRQFVNRNSEIGALEQVLYAGDRGLMWFFGLAGIGKRALAREAIRRLSADASRTATVTVQGGTGFVELHLAVCSATETPLPPVDLTEREAREEAGRIIEEFCAGGGIWLFEEVHHWLEADASANRVLSLVLQSLSVAGVALTERGAIFTSTRRPRLEDRHDSIAELTRVRGLEPGFAVALLRAAGAESDDRELRLAAVQLDGHPLALEVAARTLGSGGQPDWEAHRVTTASTMIGEIRLSDHAGELLEALAAVDGPLPGGAIAGHLKVTPEIYSEAVDEASSYALVEEQLGYLRVHALVRDFYLRALRRRHDFRDRITDLANRSRDAYATAKTGSALQVDALLTTFRLLSWSGRLQEALELHQTAFGTLLQTAIDLYDERRYDMALYYLEAVIASTEDDVRAKLYLARTLANLGRADEARGLMAELLAENPTDVQLLRISGRVEFILRKWVRALEFFERARELRPQWLAVLRDLGQVNIRLERWEAAREELHKAMQLAEPGVYVRLYYSQVLEHFGELSEAHAVAESATRADPENPSVHHRLGRVSLAQGEQRAAREAFERALELDPNFYEGAVSLVGVLLDDNEVAAARNLAARIEGMPGVRPALRKTVQARVALAEGQTERAQQLADEALAVEREAETLTLVIRIAIARLHRDELSTETTRARIDPLLRELGQRGHGSDAEVWGARLAEAATARTAP
jgi:tetratricopeptide (TPR) repeat protein